MFIKTLFSSIVLTAALCSLSAMALLKLGETPPPINLANDSGGRVDGTAWNSQEIKDKVFVMFYVAPSEKDTNNATSEAIAAKKFPAERFQSIAVINMAASFWPNSWITSSLEKKQKAYPRTIYVKDINRAFVSNWGLQDDASDVLAFDQSGRLIFRKDGRLNQNEIEHMVSLLDKHITTNSQANPSPAQATKKTPAQPNQKASKTALQKTATGKVNEKTGLSPAVNQSAS